MHTTRATELRLLQLRILTSVEQTFLLMSRNYILLEIYDHRTLM